MNEEQLRLFAPLKALTVYDESDERVHALTAKNGRYVRECTRLHEVEECLRDPSLAALGAVRIGVRDRQVVVVYFARKD